MKVFIDITLLPSDDIGHHFLWEKVFQQVHLALVEVKDTNGHSPVGISFPEFNGDKNRLGRKLRLFAQDEIIFSQLNIEHWLARLKDYVHIKNVQSVPEDIEQFIRFRRYQPKSNVERIARRAAKRQSISYAQAMEEKSSLQPVMTDAPYVWMKSLGNANRFRLFLRAERVDSAEEKGGFSTYGLSTGGVLPEF